MLLRSKKNATIILAILFGVIIIFLSASGDKTILREGATESDNDKWRNELVVVPSSSPISLLGAEYAQSGAKSATDFIANEFVLNYARSQVNKGATPLDDADVQSIVQKLSEKARAVDSVKQYRAEDLVIVPSSTSTIATYQKEATEALNIFSQKNTSNELLAVARALDSKDASNLTSLSNNIDNYQTLVNSLYSLSVPQVMLSFHLSLLQGYTNMLAGVIDMKDILADPVRGVRGIAKYNSGASLIDTAIKTIYAQK